MKEGLDETLTLHRLGLYGVLGRSLKTTNCLESINALVEERCAKVDHWQNSGQRHRWLATALLDIEPRLRKVMGYRHLPKLRAALKQALKIDTTTPKTKAAYVRSRGELQLRMGLTPSRSRIPGSSRGHPGLSRLIPGSDVTCDPACGTAGAPPGHHGEPRGHPGEASQPGVGGVDARA